MYIPLIPATVPASLHPGSRPTVQYVSSLCELPQALQPYYTQGYVLTTLHPIILSVGRSRSLPFSLLYRAILARPKPRLVRLSVPTDPYGALASATAAREQTCFFFFA